MANRWNRNPKTDVSLVQNLCLFLSPTLVSSIWMKLECFRWNSTKAWFKIRRMHLTIRLSIMYLIKRFCNTVSDGGCTCVCANFNDSINIHLKCASKTQLNVAMDSGKCEFESESKTENFIFMLQTDIARRHFVVAKVSLYVG